MTTVSEGMQGQSVDISLRSAAVAVLIEHIAGLPKEIKRDLHELMLETIECSERGDAAALKEIERTVKEILFPEMMLGALRRHESSESNEGVRKWSEHVGVRIRETRKARKWSQVELGSHCGLPQSHISRLESGQHTPSRFTLEKIAKALHISVRDLDVSEE